MLQAGCMPAVPTVQVAVLWCPAGAGGASEVPQHRALTAGQGPWAGAGCWVTLAGPGAEQCCSALLISSLLTGISPLCNYCLELALCKDDPCLIVSWNQTCPQTPGAVVITKPFCQPWSCLWLASGTGFSAASLSLKSRIEMFSFYLLNLPKKTKFWHRQGISEILVVSFGILSLESTPLFTEDLYR